MNRHCVAAAASNRRRTGRRRFPLALSALLSIAAPTPVLSQGGDPPQSPSGCSLQCANGGVCQTGEASFPDNLRISHSGGGGGGEWHEDSSKDAVLPFLRDTSDGEGEYCWCPEGWTGYNCAHQYEWCGSPGDQFPCFHGAECKQFGINYLCDCKAASWPDGTQQGQFAGFHCEHSPTEVCSVDGVEGWVGFCVNGGACKSGETQQQRMCECPPEWKGPHCELRNYSPPPPEIDVKIEPVTLDDCNMECAHDGICQEGSASFPDNLRLTKSGAVVPFLQRTNNGNAEYCWCPEGWTGFDCEHQYKYCWEDENKDGTWGGGFSCFHGGICKNIPSGGPKDYICDCAAASWPDGTSRGLFAGTHCEHEATSICWQDGSEESGRKIGFCVNGGTCNPSNVQMAGLCKCPPEWNGPHCEFYKGKAESTLPTTTTAAPKAVTTPEEHSSCSLQCNHGGVCQKGSANFPSNLKLSANNSIIPFMERTNNGDDEYCWCLYGWTGYDCAHEYDYCWENSSGAGFACFHRGTCKSIPTGGSTDFICDCGTASQPDGTERGMFAGTHCEYSAADGEICRKDGDEDGPWIGFCVNGGTCKTGETRQSRMCDCPTEWVGPHCEFRTGKQDICKEPDTNGEGGFACLNGGKCDEIKVAMGQVNLDQFMCDCSEANWGGFEKGFFAGKHCEFKATDICTSTNQGGSEWVGFCVNGGSCKAGETEQFKMCDCPSEWSGPHCENVNAEPETEQGTSKPQPAPDCSLKCANGGVCQKGTANFGILADSPDDTSLIPFLQDQSNANGEYCACPDGWTGIACDHQYKFCWEKADSDGVLTEGFACFHNSTCVIDTSVGSEYSCECSEAHFNGADKGMFAGRQCQSRATEECLSKDMTQRVGFCVNGGTCNRDRVEGGYLTRMCNCAPGWRGPHCELRTMQQNDDQNLQRPDSDPNCDLKCSNGGVCQKGSADYGIISPQNFAYSSPIPFLEYNSDGTGQYCWCPPGLTGVQCRHEYELCDPDSDDGFSCFHSSKCTNLGKGTFKTWACDCSTANNKGKDEGLFAGRFCEHEATQKCRVLGMKEGLSEKEWFCVNGGTCKKGESNAYKICQCPSGWTGPHCEYAQNSVASTEFNPKKCALNCLNGGQCVFGVKDYGNHVDINEAKELPWLSQTHSDGAHCVCPTGFTGLFCQIQAEKCGNRLWCYNGSQCKQTEVKYGAIKHYCDCSEATKGEVSFAGIGCQHKSGVFCEPKGENSEEVSFCVNGGSCYETGNEPFGCDCPDGWNGQHCEFHKTEAAAYSNPNKCNLECKNGGKCVPGVKNYGTLEGFDLPFLEEEHVDFEHCACPVGFTGLDCSVKWVGCDNKQICVHGSKCEAKGQTGPFTCNCEGVTNEKGNNVAGEHCQHEATEYCVVGQSSSHSFCTNGGVCVGPIAANKEHPGCICPPGWIGDRCEIRQKGSISTPSSQTSTTGQSASKNAAILFSVMAVIISVVILIAVVLTRKCASSEALKREELKKEQETQAGSSNDSFNAEPVQQGTSAEEDEMAEVDIL